MHPEFMHPFKRATLCLLAFMLFFTCASDSLAETDNGQEKTIKDFIGEASVPASLVKSDLPLALRTLSAPDVTPRHSSKQLSSYDRTILLGAAPLITEISEPVSPKKLLPEPDPEPGVVYVVPFTNIEAPKDFSEGVFDLFVDTLNQQSNKHDLHFVILKQGLKGWATEELKRRKYITGEISSYVEDSSCCSTNIHTEIRITYHHPNSANPVFDDLIPASSSFDHDVSTAEVERKQLTEKIVTSVSEKLSPTFETSLVSKRAKAPNDKGA